MEVYSFARAAQKVHRELRYLGLPTRNDIKDECEQLCDQLSVGRSIVELR